MGFYINPYDKSKEQFLKEKGVEVPLTFKWSDTPEGFLPVVWVNNGWMTAAAIAPSREVFDSFFDAGDRRPKRIFVVKIDDLMADANDPGFTKFVQKGNIAA